MIKAFYTESYSTDLRSVYFETTNRKIYYSLFGGWEPVATFFDQEFKEDCLVEITPEVAINMLCGYQ